MSPFVGLSPSQVRRSVVVDVDSSADKMKLYLYTYMMPEEMTHFAFFREAAKRTLAFFSKDGGYLDACHEFLILYSKAAASESRGRKSHLTFVEDIDRKSKHSAFWTSLENLQKLDPIVPRLELMEGERLLVEVLDVLLTAETNQSTENLRAVADSVRAMLSLFGIPDEATCYNSDDWEDSSDTCPEDFESVLRQVDNGREGAAILSGIAHGANEAFNDGGSISDPMALDEGE